MPSYFSKYLRHLWSDFWQATKANPALNHLCEEKQSSYLFASCLLHGKLTLDAATETAEEAGIPTCKELQSPFATGEMGTAGEGYNCAQSLVFDKGMQGLLWDRREGLWRTFRRRWPYQTIGQEKGGRHSSSRGQLEQRHRGMKSMGAQWRTSSLAQTEKVLVGQKTQSPDYLNIQHTLFTPTPILWHRLQSSPDPDSASCLAPMGNAWGMNHTLS